MKLFYFNNRDPQEFEFKTYHSAMRAFGNTASEMKLYREASGIETLTLTDLDGNEVIRASIKKRNPIH